MSTPCAIGLLFLDGGVEYVTCNCDGSWDQVGKILFYHYQDQNKLQSLIDEGNIHTLYHQVGEKHNTFWHYIESENALKINPDFDSAAYDAKYFYPGAPYPHPDRPTDFLIRDLGCPDGLRFGKKTVRSRAEFEQDQTVIGVVFQYLFDEATQSWLAGMTSFQGSTPEIIWSDLSSKINATRTFEQTTVN